MTSYEWTTRVRDFDADRNSVLSGKPTSAHPLQKEALPELNAKSDTGTLSVGSSSVADPLTGLAADPLSMFAASDDMSSSAKDPLSIAVAAASQDDKSGTRVMDDSFEPWEVKRPAILAQFTTNEKLSLTSSFLDAKGARTAAAGGVSDKVRNRLEQLDDFEDGSVKEMLDLSRQEYEKRIQELKQALTKAWDGNQRVKALKIAIQCAKLLSDTNVIQYYPSKFVHITDILATFGDLVYDRILRMSAYYPPGSSVPKMLPEDFTPDMVPANAKEICRNWFFKIASIRELLPRLLVEISILRCYAFLTSREYEQALVRLTSMIRGVGDPLVGVYVRCFLCRVGVKVAPEVRTHLMPNFVDFVATFGQLSGDAVQNQLAMQRVEMPEYLHLYTPALDWILQCVAYKASEPTLVKVLDLCSSASSNNALLLNGIMSAFPPEYISTRAAKFTELIKGASDSGMPKHHLFRTLGVSVSMSPPPKDQQLQILQEVWKVVMKIEDPAEYISCAEVWIEYPAKYFGKREVNAMLSDILKHVTPDRAYENFFGQLQSILGKILSHMSDFSVVFSMDKLLPFVDLFQKDKIRNEVCKGVMEAFVRSQEAATSDQVILHAMMYIGKILHDSMSAMTFEDERRQIAGLVVGFLTKVSFGRDFEQTLNFFVEARASFSNLDSVLSFLVHSVNMLIVRTQSVVKGNHTRKTSAFIRSCVAYNFITIPSISDVLERLQLYLASGRVALMNQALTQADEFFRGAISLIAEVPPQMEVEKRMIDTEPMLVAFVCNFLSTLLLVPDHPEQGVLTTLKGLLNAVNEYPWAADSDAQPKIFVRCLALLAAYGQPEFWYQLDGVDANDKLYACSPKYLEELTNIMDSMIAKVLEHLKELGASGDADSRKRQSKIALDLFDHVVMLADLGSGKSAGLASNLWGLALKSGVDPSRQARSRRHVEALKSLGLPGLAELKLK